MLNKKWFIMAPEGDGTESAGAGGDVVADAGAVDAGTITDAATADTGKPVGTALSQGSESKPVPAAIPEKYLVKKEDGTIDTEASSAKLADAYVKLEKRIGSGDLPPKTPEEYKIEVPEAMKETWKPGEDPLLQSFLKDAHAAGLNQKQVDLVMSKYMELAPDLVTAGKQLDAEQCTTTLRAEWKTDDQYKAGVNNAYKAAVGYFGADAEAIINEYGNDPRFIRGLAKLGTEMGEDKTTNIGSTLGQNSVDTLMTSEAYNNAKHPDHAKVSAQVKSHFDKLAAAAEKAGTSALM